MSPRGPRVLPRSCACLLVLASACAPAPDPAPPRGTARPAAAGALEIESIPSRVVAAPLFTPRGELVQVLFHLNFHNRSPRPLRIERVELHQLAGGEVLLRTVMGGRLLARSLRPVPWIVMRDRMTFAAAHRWRGRLREEKGDTVVPALSAVGLPHRLLLLRSSQVPDRIRCEVVTDGGRASRTFRVETYRQRTPLRLPVEGKWWVMAGHRFDEYHGEVVVESQTFAYDLGRLGPSLQTREGDGRRNESYLCHGQPVLAAADGEVADLHDGVAENDPVGDGPGWDQVMRQPRDMAGNFVVLRHEGEEHTVYMHLGPGLPVRLGQEVRAGDRIGRCGNSGNSTEPHLHFQLQDGQDPLVARGLPARFSGLTVHMARSGLFVPEGRSVPLPSWLVVENGRAGDAMDIDRWVPD